jgi:tryptophan synthase beta chain
MMVRDFQRIIGVEARQQCLDLVGRLPDALVACVGGGSNAMGLFHPFLEDESSRWSAARPAATASDTGRHAAPLTAGSPACCTARAATSCRTRTARRWTPRRSAPAWTTPGVGPEHALLRDTGRATYTGHPGRLGDAVPGRARQERGHPLRHRDRARLRRRLRLGRARRPADAQDLVVIVNTSGRGDKDVDTAARWFGLVTGEEIAESELVRAHEGEQP